MKKCRYFNNGKCNLIDENSHILNEEICNGYKRTKDAVKWMKCPMYKSSMKDLKI